ncbi:MAG TPA: GAF domain-containing protein [Myxococcus sp.]|nr:GAF domain-containing protein [Myxococcus sp.]
MTLPEGSLVAAVDRMSRALERLVVAPPVGVEELLRQAAATLGAPEAFVCWWNEAGTLKTLTTPGLSPEAATMCAQRLLELAPGPVEAPLPYVAEDLSRDALLAREPGLAGRLGAALLSLPLFFASGQGAAGVLAVVFAQVGRPLDEDIQRFNLFARLAGLALERERTVETSHQAAQQARTEVEEAELARLRRFQAVTEAFGRALSREEVGRVVLELGLPAVGAVAGMVHLASAGGAAELTASLGLADALLEPMRVLPKGGSDLPGYEAVRTGAPVWLESPEELRTRYPRLTALVSPGGLHALVVLPLLVEGRVFGTLGFGFTERRGFSALERASVMGLARQCAQALERSRLYERERSARLQAEAAQQRLRLLADAGALASDSLDCEATMAGVAKLAVGTFADACAVDSHEDGVVRRVAVLHADPDRASHALEDMHPPALLEEVLASGRSRMRVLPAPEDAPGPPGSVLLTPLVARQRTLGVLTFVRGGRRPAFDGADLSLAEELARRAALAIDNARLFRQARAAEEESRRSAARLHVLVQVSHLIAEAGLDLPTVLDVLARKVSEAIGDACVLQLLAEDGDQLEVVAVHHARADARAVLEESLRRYPARMGEGLSGRVAASGQALYVPRLKAEELHDERLPEAVLFLEYQGPQSVIIVPLGARGRVLGTLGVMRDAPEGREYTAEERALLESLAARAALAIEDARLYGEATQAVKARDELLSVAGHELKSPLNALQLQIHMLARMAKAAVGSGLAERAEKAARASQRLGLLIDDLMDVSRINSGRMSLKREDVDLAALARELVGRMSEELARAGCEVTLVADAPVSGRWDRLRLEQVLVNLLSNAAKYGAGHPVRVTVELQGEAARLAVRDEGIGVAPEEQERIFERFERAASVQQQYKGLGLGLWITRRIVEAHGGTIRVHSQLGEGSTFTVELPLVEVPT